MKNHTSLDKEERILWCDGDSSMSSNRIAELLLAGKPITNIFPLEIDKNVKQFNLYTNKHLTLKTDVRPCDTEYRIPQSFLTVKLEKFFLKKLNEVIIRDDITDEQEIEVRIARVIKEVKLFQQYNIENLIRATLYIVETFELHNIVWGTGRGSSCACYCLYLCGLHDVDSVLYDLELTEFFR